MAISINEKRTTTTTTTPRNDPGIGVAARYANIVAGVWLFISAFLWEHSDASRTNTWIVGLLMVIFAAAGLRAPVARFANTALSLWLFFSTLTIFHLQSITLWNNLIVAALVFTLSFVPNRGTGESHRPRRYAEA